MPGRSHFGRRLSLPLSWSMKGQPITVEGD
jgi:hypothetical protein